MFQTVIVKKSDDAIAFSGILVANNYVLVTAHLILSQKTPIDLTSRNQTFTVIQKKNEDDFTSQEAYLIGKLDANRNIATILRKYFGDIYDLNGIGENIDLFTIYVLSFDRHSNVEEVKHIWHSYKSIGGDQVMNVKIADEICIRAAPFGSRHLINSYSQGIISNNVHGILLTDCPSVLGSEGGIILSKSSQEPLGIVVSSMAGWRGEWTGLTLGITFNALFHHEDISNIPNGMINDRAKNIVKSIVYVTCGISWGTGICIDQQNGVILTNAHVVDDGNEQDIFITFQGKSIPATILFAVPHRENYDLALLKLKYLPVAELAAVTFSSDDLQIGDPVYVLGFPLFPDEFNLPSTITKGHIALLKDNVVMTTCTVLPGASGGGLFNAKGHLIGIVTSNIMDKANGNNCVYPRVNMCIPLKNIAGVLEEYLRSKDRYVLEKLIVNDYCKNGWAISKL